MTSIDTRTVHVPVVQGDHIFYCSCMTGQEAVDAQRTGIRGYQQHLDDLTSVVRGEGFAEGWRTAATVLQHDDEAEVYAHRVFAVGEVNPYPESASPLERVLTALYTLHRPEPIYPLAEDCARPEAHADLHSEATSTGDLICTYCPRVDTVCGHCSEHDEDGIVQWPCPTAAAISGAMLP